MIAPAPRRPAYALLMETETPTPTLTLTPTPTYTPTLELYMETVLSEGQGARFERTVSAGEFSISLLLFVLVVSIWGMWLFNFLREWRSGRP